MRTLASDKGLRTRCYSGDTNAAVRATAAAPQAASHSACAFYIRISHLPARPSSDSFSREGGLRTNGGCDTNSNGSAFAARR